MQLVLSRVFPAVYGQPRRFVHITTCQLKRLLILPGCIIRSLSSGIFGRKCQVSGEHEFKTQGIVSPLLLQLNADVSPFLSLYVRSPL